MDHTHLAIGKIRYSVLMVTCCWEPGKIFRTVSDSWKCLSWETVISEQGARENFLEKGRVCVPRNGS